jgi:hypothetical protein
MNTQPQPDWSEIVLYVHREVHRLPKEHREFVNAMAARLGGSELTSGQQRYLRMLFRYLGGKVT